MPDDRNAKNGRQRQPGAAAEIVRTMEDSIRQAFLTHMGEQQRQFAAIVVRRASVRSAERELAKTVRQQQHTGSHDKPEKEAQGSDQRGGTRAGGENVGPKRR
jgi:DNA gyrase/topoisomerase IV subunit B